MVINLGLVPIAGFKIPAAQLEENIEVAATVQAGLFTAPVYLPGTTWWVGHCSLGLPGLEGVTAWAQGVQALAVAMPGVHYE